MIIAQAGRFGGWSLYMKDGRVHHVYNFGGLERTTVRRRPFSHPATTRCITSSRTTAGAGLRRSQPPAIDGKPAGEARVPQTMPFVYSADEGIDVGMDNETPVTEEYERARNKFTGKIVRVTVEAK